MFIDKKNATDNENNIIELAHNFLKKNIPDTGIGEIICFLKSEYILDILEHKYIYKANNTQEGGNAKSMHQEMGGNYSITTIGSDDSAGNFPVSIPMSHAVAIHTVNVMVYSGRYFMRIKKYIENSLAKIIDSKTKTEAYEQQELERCMEMIKGILLIIKKMLCGVEFLYSVPMRDIDGTTKYLPGNAFAIPTERYKPILTDVIEMYQQFSQQDKEKANAMLDNFFGLFTMNYRVVLQYLKAMRGFIDQLTDICPLEKRSISAEMHSLDDDIPYDLRQALRAIVPENNITTHAKVMKAHIADGMTVQKAYNLEQIIDKLVKILSSPIGDVSALYYLMLSVADLAAIVPQMKTKLKTGVDTNNQSLIKIQEAIASMYNSRKMGVGQFIKFSGQLVNNVIALVGLQNAGKIDIEKIMIVRNTNVNSMLMGDDFNNAQAIDKKKIKQEQSNGEQERKKFSTIVDRQNRKDDTTRGIAGFK